MAGIIRRIDEKRRLVIPTEMLNYINIKALDYVELTIDKDTLYVRKAIEHKCIICGSSNVDFVKVNDSRICCSCATLISKKMQLLND